MSREEIFANIRRGLKRGEPSETLRKQVLQRIHARQANLIPARAQLAQAEQIELFRRMASAAAAELIDLHSLSDLPSAVSGWLKHQQIDHLVSATNPELMELDWSPAEGIKLEHRIAQSGDRASLTLCHAGIAETGTLMLHSQPHSPTTLNFLPDCHLVLLKHSQVVGVYEEAWTRLREIRGADWPRTVNMITGPSRSADIGQVLQMGAHGPCALVILMLNDL